MDGSKIHGYSNEYEKEDLRNKIVIPFRYVGNKDFLVLINNSYFEDELNMRCNLNKVNKIGENTFFKTNEEGSFEFLCNSLIYDDILIGKIFIYNQYNNQLTNISLKIIIE